MADDYGIIITQPGTDANGVAKSRTTLNTSYPMLKLDTQNDQSFQTITLSLVNDPPEPGGAGHRYTIVYQFAHGYKYKPAIETLFHVTSAPPGSHYTTPYFLDWTILAAQSVDDYAALYAVADSANVYYIVDKWNDGAGSPNLLTGTNIDITTHVFLDGVGV